MSSRSLCRVSSQKEDSPSARQVPERDKPERGRAAVEERLLKAASDLLDEVGPNQLSVRTVSKRARANSGQVYHYFGSKQALLQAAMRRLFEHHYEHMRGRSAMGLIEDDQYWRAMGHAVLDGAEYLFRLEIDAGKSAPLDYIERKRQEAGGSLDTEQSAYALANVALTLGWVTFEPFLLALVREGKEAPSAEDLRRCIAELLDRRMTAAP